MKVARRLLAALGAGLALPFFAGCGGGGGGDNGGGPGDNSGIVLGKVISANGGVAPGTQVTQQDGFASTTSLAGGAYRLTSVSPGIDRINASATINNVPYSGTTQVLALPNAIVSNADIYLAPNDAQATVSGTVLDQSGHAIDQARVFLANTNSSSGNISSLVAYTDRNGHYTIYAIPTSVNQYQLAASVPGFQNNTMTITGLQPGEQRSLSTLTLSPSSDQQVSTPTNVAAESFTQPTSSPQPQLAGQTASDISSAYEAVRRLASPQYAKQVTGASAHSVKATRLHSHASGFSNYAIEMDLFFDESVRASLAGFRVYSSADTASVTPYDFLQDPLANIYVDLDPYYTPDRQFNFAVSAVNTDNSETALSPIVSVEPLQRIYLNQPALNAHVSNPVLVSWAGTARAEAYDIYIYNQFPSIQTSPVLTVSNVPSTQSSYTLTQSLSAGSYWVVVAATADSGAEVSATQFVPFTVQ